MKKKVCIIGATSHIAKGLIHKFYKDSNYEMFLYARNIKKLKMYLKKESLNGIYINTFDKAIEPNANVIINCVGFGKAKSVHSSGYQMFQVFEDYDNLCIKYIMDNPCSLYIYFSSGAIYGTDFKTEAKKLSIAEYSPNNIKYNDYYRVIKLYTEAKHRSLNQLKIWDIRVFNYFSEHIDINDSMLITEIVRCIKKKQVFKTNDVNITRDFVHPDDLYQLIEGIIDINDGNNAVDIYSKKPVTKKELLGFLKENYDLNYVIDKITKQQFSPTGTKKNYFTSYKIADKVLKYKPKYDSLESIRDVLEKIL
jgi:hypothetical protein